MSKFIGTFEKDLDENSRFIFPTVHTTSPNGDLRFWSIIVRTKNNIKSISDMENDHSLNSDILIEYGTHLGKVNKMQKTIKVTGKQSAFTLAMEEAYKKWKQRQPVQKVGTSKLIAPMLATVYKAWTKGPVYVQYKLDGIRCLAYMSTKDNSVALYTREKHPIINQKNIINELIELLELIKRNKFIADVVLDGELYLHGHSLQDISGEARRHSGSKLELQYHIFDYVSKEPFSVRHAKLVDLFSTHKFKYLKLVKTVLAKTEKALEKIYKTALSKKYEGVMVRSDAPYDYHTERSIRSKHLQKMKPIFDDEFKIVGFKSGTGRDKNAIIWELETDNGKKFHSVPLGTIESRIAEFHNQTKKFTAKGKKMTVEFYGISDAGVPLRAKAKVIRDYE
jgi:ATP-dependent DNA ligase